MKMKRTIVEVSVWMGLAVIGLYWIVSRPDSRASDCESKISPDGRYMAELCLVRLGDGANPDYLGRVYDANTGALLVRRRFATPVPQLDWWKDEISFSRGGNGGSDVKLPPTLYDRLTAELPLP